MKKRVMSIVLVLCMALALLPTAAFAAGETPFADVSPAAWYRDAVQYVNEKGWMTGTGPDTFSPEAATSRGMLATILYRVDGSPAVTGECPFNDVTAGSYYEIPITWAAENDIVTGYGYGQYGPDDPVTREQIVTILYRFVLGKNYDTTTRDDLSSFVDADRVSSYAADAMGWAVGTELVFGVGDDRLAPTETATRAQFAAILSRLVQYLETAPLVSHTVTFQYNYGSKGEYETAEVEYGETVTAPASPTRSGYTFQGWYTQPTGGEKYDFDSIVTDDLTLYAHWNASGASGTPTPSTPSTPSTPTTTYTLTYDANSDVESSFLSSTTHKANSVVTLSDTKPVHDAVGGKAVVFIGWSETKYKKIYSVGETAPDTVASVIMTADTTVYAVWGYDTNDNGIADVVENGCALIYDANGGSGAVPDPQIYELGDGVTLDSTTKPTHEAVDGTAVVFAGWTIYEKVATHRIYSVEDKAVMDDFGFLISTSVTMTGNTTVYAVWGYDADNDGTAGVLEGGYTLTYDANGGYGTVPESKMYEAGTTVTLVTDSQPSHEDGDWESITYRFGGWSETKYDPFVQYWTYPDVSEYVTNTCTMDNDKTVYAVWSGNSTGGGGGGGGGGG